LFLHLSQKPYAYFPEFGALIPLACQLPHHESAVANPSNLHQNPEKADLIIIPEPTLILNPLNFGSLDLQLEPHNEHNYQENDSFNWSNFGLISSFPSPFIFSHIFKNYLELTDDQITSTWYHPHKTNLVSLNSNPTSVYFHNIFIS